MKKIGLIFVLFLSLVCFLVLSACGQANSITEPTPESTVEPTPESTVEPTPKLINYEALVEQLNEDILSPIDDVAAKIEEMDSSDASDHTSEPKDATTSEEKINDSEANAAEIDDDDIERIANALISGGVFEVGEECVMYRFWSAGIDKEFIDLLGSDGTKTSAAVYSELLKTFVANYDALHKAVALYEPDAVLVLHVVENSEATDPIIVVENGKITYDYATEQGYFVSEKEEAFAEDAGG